MSRYDHRAVEEKWQRIWAETKAFATPEHPRPDKKQYILDMFPYPSGAGLHVGHPRGYTATDVIARMLRAQGYDVLHPMGWDAFGLPAENTAIKEGVHPREITKRNIARFREQLQALGLSYDWDREFSTTDPDYYRWTQWIFLQLYQRGLAYEAELPIWWCPKDKTGLANEEVVNGACERCGTTVERKQLRQWVLKITEYADRLLEGLDDLDWPESIKTMQRNWIGKSSGALIHFPVVGSTETVDVFTTRIDTIFSAAFIVVAPEHPLLKSQLPERERIEAYVKESLAKSDLDRQSDVREKSGAFTGLYTENPANGQKIPVWVGDFVLGGYGTGAVFGDAHDERDFIFAKRFDIPLTVSLVPPSESDRGPVLALKTCYTDDGILINSGEFDGLTSAKARTRIAKWLHSRGAAALTTQYKLRDWVFSRQRYWGEPIPLIHCPTDGIVPVPEDQLPVLLPDVEQYEPTGTGESPLAGIHEWVNTTCPQCGGPAKRETNTMPQWAGSCWYYLRFTDPKNTEALASPQALKSWLAVDTYVGGAEHAVLHLLYARFWHKVLFDAGHIPNQVGDEPFLKLRNVGLILGENREKMSKSRGNVINPDELVEKYGADTLRAYEMFLGPFGDSMPWSTRSMVGVRRWLDKVWELRESVSPDVKDSAQLEALLNETVRKVTNDIEGFRFNTAVSALMILANAMRGAKTVSKATFGIHLQLLTPFAPHLAEELWETLGYEGSVRTVPWPKAGERSVATEQTIVVQVNGKVRGTVVVAADADQQIVEEAAKALSNVQKFIPSDASVRSIYVPGKILNLIVSGS